MLGAVRDQHVREFERRFRETGGVEAEAAWLSVRLQAGGVTFADLKLAARLGHEAARRALGEAAPRVPESVLSRWLPAVGAHSEEAPVRCAIAALAATLELQEDPWMVEDVLAVACACVLHGPLALRGRIRGLAEQAPEPADVGPGLRAEDRQVAMFAVASATHLLAALGGTAQPEHELLATLERARDAHRVVIVANAERLADDVARQEAEPWLATLTAHLSRYEVAYRAAFEEAARHPATQASAALIARMAGEVVPWALGMEPPELRVKADDVFGDVTPYRRPGRPADE